MIFFSSMSGTKKFHLVFHLKNPYPRYFNFPPTKCGNNMKLINCRSCRGTNLSYQRSHHSFAPDLIDGKNRCIKGGIFRKRLPLGFKYKMLNISKRSLCNFLSRPFFFVRHSALNHPAISKLSAGHAVGITWPQNVFVNTHCLVKTLLDSEAKWNFQVHSPRMSKKGQDGSSEVKGCDTHTDCRLILVHCRISSTRVRVIFK